MEVDGERRLVTVLRPIFLANCDDFMKKGNKFYAFYNPDTKLWCTNEDEIYDLIDKDLYAKRKEIMNESFSSKDEYYDSNRRLIICQSIINSNTRVLDDYTRWVSHLSDNHAYKPLDNELLFKDDEPEMESYASKKLPYNMIEESCPNYEELISTLYDYENRQKLEWAIGSIFAGDSKYIEKMVVLYGKPKSGKSTVLDIIKDLFSGYWSLFNADALTDRSSQFATELFRNNPLVAIQDDGSMAKIDSPKINEIISHKDIIINEKHKSQYHIKSNAMLFMATNSVVDLNDNMGGMTRRLLDIYPSNKKIPVDRYRVLTRNIKNEYGAIAYHCLKVYESLGKEYYLDYSPIDMISRSNYIYNFFMDNYDYFVGSEDQHFLRDEIYQIYEHYIEANNIMYKLNSLRFSEQIVGYFERFVKESVKVPHLQQYRRNVFINFKKEMLDSEYQKQIKDVTESNNNYIWLHMDKTKSVFDKVGAHWKAQYTTKDGFPRKKWKNVDTILKDLDSTKEHYVELPLNHIVLDFDIPNPKTGEKDAELNIKAAADYISTYAEFSKSGKGVHLHYIYDGDVTKLANLIDKHIEIKHSTNGNPFCIRRRLSKCNDLEITTLHEGMLPLKEKKKVALNEKYVMNEKQLRIMIERNLRKEIHGATKPSIDFINKLLDDAYASGEPYDVSDMRGRILAFANNSTHQASNCVNIVAKMKFKSETDFKSTENFKHDKIIFFDVEVFPNFFCICYKPEGEGEKVVQLINPSNTDVLKLLDYKLVGFNNKDYDNHIIYARAYFNYSNAALYNLSRKLIKHEKNERPGFDQAKNLSYTDVYDFASAANKKGLKKWEIELGISHIENSYPWDEPLPESAWKEVADYCSNDVIATEVVFNHLRSDFVAREILADLSGLTINDSTNKHTSKIILKEDNNPSARNKFVYTHLDKDFPGYKFEAGKSYYRGEVVGEGGYVYAEPGCYTDVALLDIASMHPSSITALNLFGPYTKNFNELKDARLAIKHKDFDKARKMMGGKLAKYLDDEENIKNLPNALKTAINSVYGMTSSKSNFNLKDFRNVDNIVAKRGALFMVDLKHAVQEKGFTVAHIKTDSIKIPNATPSIIEFVMEYGKKWGYTFEHEATYKRMCLVNDAVYIALYPDNHWTATGTQFQVPYVYKTLFTKENIIFNDLCIAMSTKTSFHLDFNEDLPEGEHNYIFAGKVGNFCPVKEGCGGGQLMRVQIVNNETKYYAATGSKGYRWKEAEVIKANCLEDQIDFSYFDKLADAARKEIEKYTDFEWFSDPNSNNELVPFKG